jgi:hypothetical protein
MDQKSSDPQIYEFGGLARKTIAVYVFIEVLASPVARTPLARDDPGPWLSQVKRGQVRTKG